MRRSARHFADHQSVQHTRNEYARGNAPTNTVEGFYSIFKRGMIGLYQHGDERHFHRYLAEFDFRAQLGVSDRERAEDALVGIAAKRLTYRRINEGEAEAS